MSDRLLKILIYSSGAICFIVFLSARILPLYNLFMTEKYVEEYWENKKYGEMYYSNMINHFKEENLPPHLVKYRFSGKMPKLEDADILIFGDSFFDFSRMTTFPERLANELNKKVYFERYDVPTKSLAENSYQNHSPKIVLYETSERYIDYRFLKKHRIFEQNAKPSGLWVMHKKIINLVIAPNSEKLYTSLLSQSYLTRPIYSAIETFKFNYFGYLPMSTPKYTFYKNQPWLFFGESVDKNSTTSFYYQFTDEEIDTYCNNIADLATKLKDRYNLELIFMPLPSKYTIYHKFLNNDPYNNLIPRIYKGLEKRQIPVVKVFDEYLNSDEILFYGTDTHWNPKGLEIALKKALHVIDSVKKVKKIP